MSPAGGTRRILLVDDDPLILRGYGQRLLSEGWDVTTAADGYEALNAAAQANWDLILLDLRLPYRNGVEILRTLKSRKETSLIPVYVLAQPGDADLVDRALREGADGVFEKAKIAPRDLGVEIESILEGRRRPRTGASVQTAPSPSQTAVPAAVEEIARRFRKDAGPVRPSPMRSAGGPSVPMAQAAAAAASMSSSVPGRALRMTADDPVVVPSETAAPVRSGPVSATGARAFDVVLNRMVGQSAALAQALGLPANFACPICAGQLVLRLEPDAQVEFGVQGNFFCPRCTA